MAKDKFFGYKKINGKFERVNEEGEKTSDRNLPKEDLSINSYIDKYGGIKSGIDGSVHTTKQSYLDHLKQHNKTILDW